MLSPSVMTNVARTVRELSNCQSRLRRGFRRPRERTARGNISMKSSAFGNVSNFRRAPPLSIGLIREVVPVFVPELRHWRTAETVSFLRAGQKPRHSTGETRDRLALAVGRRRCSGSGAFLDMRRAASCGSISYCPGDARSRCACAGVAKPCRRLRLSNHVTSASSLSLTRSIMC